MNLLFFFALFGAAVLCNSCSGDERILDNTSSTWYILAAESAATPAIAKYNQETHAITSPDIFFAANNIALPGPVSAIKEFRENLYFVIPSAKKIIVAAKTTMLQVGIIDFSTVQRTPSSITFSNASVAFVGHGEGNVVSVVDISNFTIARTVVVGNVPSAVLAMGNQVFVANRESNTISRIDSRTFETTAVYPTAPAPIYIELDVDGSEFLVVCAGNGKFNSDSTSPPTTMLFDGASGAVLAEFPINDNKNTDEIPGQPAISASEFAFIPLPSGLYRFDVKIPAAPRKLYNDRFVGSYYNARRRTLMLWNSEGITTAQSSDAKIIGMTPSKNPVMAVVDSEN